MPCYPTAENATLHAGTELSETLSLSEAHRIIEGLHLHAENPSLEGPSIIQSLSESVYMLALWFFSAGKGNQLSDELE